MYAEGIESATFDYSDQGKDVIIESAFRNQGLVLGGENKEDAINAFKETGLTWGPDFRDNDKEVYSVVYVASPYDLHSGMIYVDPERENGGGLTPAYVPSGSMTLKKARF